MGARGRRVGTRAADWATISERQLIYHIHTTNASALGTRCPARPPASRCACTHTPFSRTACDAGRSAPHRSIHAYQPPLPAPKPRTHTSPVPPRPDGRGPRHTWRLSSPCASTPITSSPGPGSSRAAASAGRSSASGTGPPLRASSPPAPGAPPPASRWPRTWP